MKKHNLAFVDVETTGLDPLRHELIELAVVLARQIPTSGRGPTVEVLEEHEWKIKPEHIDLADPESLQINGYMAGKWIFAADLPKVMEAFGKITKSASLVAHNVSFDQGFIDQAFKKSGVKNEMHYHKIDTLSLAFGKLYHDPRAEKFSLRSLCEHFGIPNPNAHTALSDARAAFELYKKLVEA